MPYTGIEAMGMKLACLESIVPGEAFAEKLVWLEQNGFNGIELTVREIGRRTLELQEAFARSSVEISAMHGGYAGIPLHRNPEEAEQARQYLLGLLKYCALLGCPGLVVGTYYRAGYSSAMVKAPEPASEEEIEWLATALDPLAGAAEDYGVQLYLEPVNRYECDLIHTIADAVRVCEQVGRKSMRVAAGTFHMNIEEESLTVPLARYYAHIGYVHVADSNRRAPGQGHLPFHEFAIAHRQLGYTGYLSLDCTVAGEEELLRAKRYMDRL